MLSGSGLMLEQKADLERIGELQLGSLADRESAREPERRFGLPAWFNARRIIVAMAVVSSIFVVSFGYSWWRDYRTAQYKEACTRARDSKAWGRLELASKLWLDWDRGSDDAKVFRAEAMLQAGDLESTVGLLDTVSPEYHSCLQAYAFQGEILFSDLNRPLDAEKVWLRMLDIDEKADLARKQLVYFYSMTLQFDKLSRILRRAIEIGREPPETYTYLILSRSLNFTDGMVVIEKWRKGHPDDETLAVAEAYFFAKNRTSGADGIFEKTDVVPGDLKPMNDCLVKYPQNLNVLTFHLEKRSFDGDLEGTEALLETCPPEAQTDPRYWKIRAWAARMRGKPEAARVDIEKAIALDPFDWRARWEQASILRLLGERKAAETAAEIASEGKAIEKMLMELPNAQMLTWGNVERLHRYAQQVGDPLVVEGLERRMPEDLLQSGAQMGADASPD